MSSVKSRLILVHNLDFVLKNARIRKAGYFRVDRQDTWEYGHRIKQPALYGAVRNKDVNVESFITMLAHAFPDYVCITVVMFKGGKEIVTSTMDRLIVKVDGVVYPSPDHYDHLGSVRWYMRASNDNKLAKRIKVYREGSINATEKVESAQPERC